LGCPREAFGDTKRRNGLCSRPEPAFRERFSQYAKLRLEDLTKEDIRKCVTGEMSSSLSAVRVKADSGYHSLIHIICQKANGVFIWVVLVIRSLKRGMSNKDSWLELNKRIEKCPSDLQKLFSDMWSRLGEEEIYLPAAAKFFNYTLTARFCTNYPESQHEYLSPWELLAATEDVIQAGFLELGPSIHAEEVINKCEEIVNEIDTQCAGLLECSRPEDGRLVAPFDSASPYKLSSPYLRMRIGFVHRTAQDYLTGTSEGSQLLSHDKSTQEERLHRLLRADLVITTTWRVAMNRAGTGGGSGDFRRHLNDIQYNRRLLGKESEHELLSILWYTCSIAFSKYFVSHRYNTVVPFCIFQKRPGLTTILASCNLFDLVPKYAQVQNPGEKTTYNVISYIIVCAVSNL